MDSEQSETPPQQPQAGSPAPAAHETDEPGYTHRSTGFIGQLPHDIRHQLGLMILDGVPFQKILDTIGQPVQHINVGHITRWKANGYKFWLADFQRNQALKTTRDDALALLKHKAGMAVQDAGRTVASAQLYELLISFNPTAFAKLMLAKPELYLRIISILARLSEGETSCSHHRALQSAIEAKLPSAHGDPDRKLVSAETLKDIARQAKLL